MAARKVGRWTNYILRNVFAGPFTSEVRRLRKQGRKVEAGSFIGNARFEENLLKVAKERPAKIIVDTAIKHFRFNKTMSEQRLQSLRERTTELIEVLGTLRRLPNADQEFEQCLARGKKAMQGLLGLLGEEKIEEYVTEVGNLAMLYREAVEVMRTDD